MPNANADRVFQFAYRLLDANIAPHEIYQECINFIQSCNEQASKESLFIYKLTPEIMEQAAQAVSDAQNKMEEARLAPYRSHSERRAQANNPENWLSMEAKG